MIWYTLFLLLVQNVVAWRYTNDDLMSFVTVSCSQSPH